MALKTHLKQVDERIAAVDDKCEHLKQSMEELSQRHGESSNEIRKTLDSVTGSLRDTGMGLQRVLDKQELVDAHVLLSKLGKEASDVHSPPPAPPPAAPLAAPPAAPPVPTPPPATGPPAPVPPPVTPPAQPHTPQVAYRLPLAYLRGQS
ncbi:hypothetical protein BSKO_13667 [Bryopsis sp. KO-2023]|nr:hypothetical protein BSKO_13667 [Bryopsis sp. KO-2023]